MGWKIDKGWGTDSPSLKVTKQDMKDAKKRAKKGKHIIKPDKKKGK